MGFLRDLEADAHGLAGFEESASEGIAGVVIGRNQLGLVARVAQLGRVLDRQNAVCARDHAVPASCLRLGVVGDPSCNERVVLPSAGSRITCFFDTPSNEHMLWRLAGSQHLVDGWGLCLFALPSLQQFAARAHRQDLRRNQIAHHVPAPNVLFDGVELGVRVG